MGKPSKTVLEFMSKYKIDTDEIWEVHGSTWVVKHKALERVAVDVGVKWDHPEVHVCDLSNKIAVICAYGRLGEQEEWSFGEASPANNKNSYPMAMAEKRARDRVILKLLVSHGALYSKSEADEFTQPVKRENPHVTRPEDIFDGTEEDVLPRPDLDSSPISKAKANPLFKELQTELWKCGSVQQMESWSVLNKDKIGKLPDDWYKMLRGVYVEHKAMILEQETGDNTRMQ